MAKCNLLLYFQILCGIPAPICSTDSIDLTFPEGFLIGTATSAYQIEGAWNLDGKGENIWDHYLHNSTTNSALDKANGDISTDFYHKYKEDIALLKDIGFENFRFSLSWARIFPTGDVTEPNQAGISFYHSVFDELEKRNITPFVTLYHWDHPQKLEDDGGWFNESTAYAFADYARFVFKEYGNRVKYFSTINEPYIYCVAGYSSTEYAPGRNVKAGHYLCHHTILKAHALAYHVYDKEFRGSQHGKIGIVLPCFQYYSKDKNDSQSADIAYEFQCGWTAHPIFSKEGDYPEIMKTQIAEISELQGLKESKLPTFSKEWIDKIKGSSDYLGLNHYSSAVVEPLPKSEAANWPNDEGLKYLDDPSWPTAQNKWLKIVPEGLGDVLRSIKRKYNNPPVYIMENGVCDGNGTNDDMRINYFYSYMKEMLIAMKRDGCDVQVYMIWSFLDSFEWNYGYRDKFGIIEVDFNDVNRNRTPKKSVAWVKSMLKSRTLKPSY